MIAAYGMETWERKPMVARRYRGVKFEVLRVNNHNSSVEN